MKKNFTIAAVLLLVVLVGFIFWKSRPKKDGLVLSGTQGRDAEKRQDLLPAINGVMSDIYVANKRPIAVMVENFPDARPQSGLTDADVVYEALAEGGVTRFEAIFQTKEAANIGPVRSARDYYAQIANEWGAIYAHVGGSDEAIKQLKDGYYSRLSDANEYYNENYFQRIKSRLAPHNVYTSVGKLNSLAEYRKFDMAAKYSSWPFKDDSPSAASSTEIAIDFSLADYAVKWQYDASANGYKRILAGLPHKDLDSGKQITAKNIIIQYVKVTPIPNDPKLRVDTDMVGGGKAAVFRDNQTIEGIWKKAADGKTRYYDASGKEIELNRGQIWVELVPDDGRRVTL